MSSVYAREVQADLLLLLLHQPSLKLSETRPSLAVEGVPSALLGSGYFS